MIRQLPRIDILRAIPDPCLQALSVLLMGVLFMRLLSQKSLPSRGHYWKSFCLVANPITIHYLWTQPQVSMLMSLATLVCLNRQYRWILVGILVILRPSFFAVVAAIETKQWKKGKIVKLACVVITRIFFGEYFITPFSERHYPEPPLTSEPSLNFIWLIRSHMFPEYQDLYNIFFLLIPMMSIFPLRGLDLPSTMCSSMGIFMGVFLLEYCPIGWHYVLGISYWVNYWTNREKLIQQDEMIRQKIKERQEKNRQKSQFIQPYRFKVWHTIGTILMVGTGCFTCFLWMIIEKWGVTYQLNTGYVLMFALILWLMHSGCIVEMVNLCLPKDHEEWEEYVESLKVPPKRNALQRIMMYLTKQWETL